MIINQIYIALNKIKRYCISFLVINACNRKISSASSGRYIRARTILFHLKSNNNLNWCVTEHNKNVYYKL